MATLLPDADNQTRYNRPHILPSPDGLRTVYTKPTPDVKGIAVPMLWISNSDGSNAYPLNMVVRNIKDVEWTENNNSIRVNTPEGKIRVIDVTSPSAQIADQIDAGARNLDDDGGSSPNSTNTLINDIRKNRPAVTKAAELAGASASTTPDGGQLKSNPVTRFMNRLAGSPQATPPPKKDEAKDKLKEETKEKAQQQIKKQAVKQGERLAARIAARAATLFAAATSEVWIPILLAILGIGIASIAIAAMVGVGQSGILGSSFHADSGPNTELTALANAGDVFSRRQLDATDIPAITKAMDEVIAQAKAKKPQDDEAIAIANEVKSLVTSYSSNDSKVDQQVLDKVRADLDKLSAKGYSGVAASEIGIKIANLAYYYAGTQAGQQKYLTCSVEDKTACNSFVIKIMHETGADPGYDGRAYDQYLYTKKNTTCYESFTITSTSQLAQGDIVYRPRTIKGIGHVAIYIGNGRIAAASLNDHNPKTGRWYDDLSAAARLKGGVCTTKTP